MPTDPKKVFCDIVHARLFDILIFSAKACQFLSFFTTYYYRPYFIRTEDKIFAENRLASRAYIA